MSYLRSTMKSKVLLATIACCSLALTSSAGVEQTVADLLPKLAAPKVEDRYGPQMELQSLALNAARPGAEAERVALAKILAAKASDPAVPQPARVWIVRQLEYIGGAESVRALTTLLDGRDAELRECARRALEKNPASAATASLRTALKKGGEPVWEIGLIQSLGERGDARSVSLIAQALSQPAMASAAAEALSKIATADAVGALWAAYDRKTPAAADALIAAAGRLLAQGQGSRAAAIYLKLHTNPGSAPLRAAALSGLAKADPAAATPFILPALSADDPRLQEVAVDAACVAYGKSASSVLAGLLPNLNPSAKVCVLHVLGPVAEPEVIAAAGDREETVQLAALERLGQIGSAASISVLLQAAAMGQSEAQRVAAAALARVNGPGAGEAISNAATGGDPKIRAAAITALVGRDDRAVLPVLLRYAGESDPEVSRAACSALERMGTDNELNGLIQLVLAGKAPGARDALQAVASRAHEKSAVVRKLIAQTQGAAPEQAASLFEVLALLGGNEALAAVSSSAGGGNEQVQDAAVRALANWPDFAATKALLVIANDPNATVVHRVLAIQAVARLVETSGKEPAAARLDAALAAMRAATRDQDKTLLLSALGSVPDPKAAAAIKPFLSDPKFQQEAGLAGISLAQSLRRNDKPAARELAQAVKDARISDDLTRKADAILKRK
jgi:HEAT repeat protein